MPARSTHRRTAKGSLVGIACLGLVGALVAAESAQVTSSAATAPVAPSPAKPDRLKVTTTAIAPVSAPSVGKAASPALKATADEGLAAPAGMRLLAYTKAATVPGFAMYGVTWDHRDVAANVSVSTRTRSGGSWSTWETLETDLDGGPITTAADSSFRDGTEPAWVGQASGIEVAVYGTGRAPKNLEVSTIDPGADPTGSAATAGKAAVPGKAGTGKVDAFMNLPPIITRRSWGADPSLGDACWAPRFGKTFKAVIIHHTAGSNDYTAAESAALVRGIYAYHTQSRGWCDIGYNFLVDRFGRIYEGRRGGIRRPVRGAHAGDYNVDTTGISLMGNFDTAVPTTRMKDAVVKLTAWRLGTAYLGAYGRPFLYDGRFNRISGHRDVMATACPGKNVYAWLPELRARVEASIGTWMSPIERYWRSPAGVRRNLGAVAIGEQRYAGGRFTSFRRGTVYTSKFGRRVLDRGLVLQRYKAMGQPLSYLGYPTSRAAKVGGTGSVVNFQGGQIYASTRAGAHDMRRGRVLATYRNLGGPASRLGFPTTSVVVRPARVVGHFQHGNITYDTATKKVAVNYR